MPKIKNQDKLSEKYEEYDQQENPKSQKYNKSKFKHKSMIKRIFKKQSDYRKNAKRKK